MTRWVALAIFLVSVPVWANKRIVVDLNEMKWQAYNREVLVKEGEAIGGRAICPKSRRRSCKTPKGTYQIYAKHNYEYRSGEYPLDCKERWKCGARMYYFMPFHRKGIGLHGSDMMVGKNESHGCIRLYKKDAAWLSKKFVEIGTEVIILPY